MREKGEAFKLRDHLGVNAALLKSPECTERRPSSSARVNNPLIQLFHTGTRKSERHRIEACWVTRGVGSTGNPYDHSAPGAGQEHAIFVPDVLARRSVWNDPSVAFELETRPALRFRIDDEVSSPADAGPINLQPLTVEFRRGDLELKRRAHIPGRV